MLLSHYFLCYLSHYLSASLLGALGGALPGFGTAVGCRTMLDGLLPELDEELGALALRELVGGLCRRLPVDNSFFRCVLIAGATGIGFASSTGRVANARSRCTL